MLARRFALRVAAKVAVCASIGGCGQTFAGPLADAGPTPSPDAPPSPVVRVSVDASGDADSCNLTSSRGEAGVSEQTFTCCADRLATLVADAGSVSSVTLAQAAATDPEVLACCQVIIRRITQDNQDNSPDVTQDRALVAGELFACCGVTPGGAAQVGCEAWGPPVPPEMPHWLAGRAEVA